MTGKVYWITGLSGAGKTSVGTLLYQYIKKKKPNVLFLDGDEMRTVFGNNHGHTISERKTLAHQYSKLCKMIADQDVDVICATISMFHDVQSWNRKHIQNYVEIYMQVPMAVLEKRDQKKLYSRALRGEVKNVVGVDVAIEEPRFPDIVLINDGRSTLAEIFIMLEKQLFKE